MPRSARALTFWPLVSPQKKPFDIPAPHLKHHVAAVGNGFIRFDDQVASATPDEGLNQEKLNPAK